MLSAADWTYRVRPQDNIWDLTSRYLKPDVPWQKLQAYNKVADPYHLPPGMTMRIPIAWLRLEPANATVVAVMGGAHVQRSDGAQPENVTPGMTLAIGARVITDHDASLTLQFAERSQGPRVVRQLVVGEHRTGNDVGPHETLYACAPSRAPSMWTVASLAASSGVFPRFRATM